MDIATYRSILTDIRDHLVRGPRLGRRELGD